MAVENVLAKMAVIISANNAELNYKLAQSQTSIQRFTTRVNALAAGLGAAFGTHLVFQGLSYGIGVIADFERRMSEVRAITGAVGSEFDSLRNDALNLGKVTRYTSEQVAELQVAYGRLGFTTREILAATKATLDLAAATGEDLAKSADVAGSTVRGFGLDATETQRVVDVMASSFNKTALGLDNFTESMKYVAPVANAAGATVEETTALLGVLSDAGIRGSMAGTSLRKIFTDMTKDGRPLKERLAELGKRGITLADSFDEVGRTAQTSLLILTENTEKTALLTEELKKANGEAAEMARIMEDNLTGDAIKLKSAFEGLVLGTSQLSGSLRVVTQDITSLVAAISSSSSTLGKFFADTISVIGAPLRLWAEVFGEDYQKIIDDAAKQSEEKLKAITNTVNAAFDSGNLEAYIKALDGNIYKEEIIAAIRERQARELKDQLETINKMAAKLSEIQALFPFKRPEVGLPPSETNEFGQADWSKLDMTVPADLDNPVEGIIEQIEFNKELYDSIMHLTEARQADIEKMQEAASVAVSMGEAIGQTMGDIITGQENYAQSLARFTGEIIELFLKQSIAAMIAASIKDPTTPLPFAKIAVASIGIGLVKSLFSQIGGSGGGSGISGGYNGGIPVGSKGGNVYLDVRGRASGYSLEIVRDKEGYRRSRVG